MTEKVIIFSTEILNKCEEILLNLKKLETNTKKFKTKKEEIKEIFKEGQLNQENRLIKTNKILSNYKEIKENYKITLENYAKFLSTSTPSKQLIEDINSNRKEFETGNFVVINGIKDMEKIVEIIKDNLKSIAKNFKQVESFSEKKLRVFPEIIDFYKKTNKTDDNAMKTTQTLLLDSEKVLKVTQTNLSNSIKL
jgi:hypothetical protein